MFGHKVFQKFETKITTLTVYSFKDTLILKKEIDYRYIEIIICNNIYLIIESTNW
jgi:hypothetical protein